MTDYTKYKNRKVQAQKRDESIPLFLNELVETKTKALEIMEKKPWVTEQEQTDLLEKVDETRDWLNGKIEEQAALSPEEDPAYTVDDVDAKMKTLRKLADKVFSKKKPKEPKKKKEEEKVEDKEEKVSKEEEEVINLDDEEFDDEKVKDEKVEEKTEDSGKDEL